MELKNISELLDRVKEQSKVKRLAVAAAADHNVIAAVHRARRDGIIDPFLIGDKEKMERIIDEMEADIPRERLIHEPDVDRAAEAAVGLARDGQVDFLMKGLLNTSNMLRAILNKTHGLEHGKTLSHISINELPRYHKLLVVTDAGIVISPSLEQKADIIRNAAGALRAMGYECPKVAVLAALEKVNPAMQETVDAAALKEMNRQGLLGDCVVEGPISVDLALDPEAAAIKGYESPVTGNADIFVVPNIACGNILNKSLRYLGGSRQVGAVLGAKTPIVLTSRGASAESKYLSIAVASAMA